MSQSLQQPHRVITVQQNEVHQPQQQHRQQQPPMNTNDILIQSDFSTLHHPNTKVDKQIETKYDILFTCLKAVKWKLVVDNDNVPLLVSPNTNYDDLQNLLEGGAYIYAFAYGHQKSDETLERCNKLYSEYVLGTELGRGLIQQHISSLTSSTPSTTTPPKVNKEDNKLAARTLNFMMGELSITDQTPLQQNEEAIVAAELILEQLKSNREILLRQESKKKRQLESVSHDEDYITNEKRPRTEKEEDDVVDVDSINTSQDAELDMESDNELKSIVVLKNTDVSLLDNTDVSVSNCRDEEEQAPRDEVTVMDIDTPTSSQDVDNTPYPGSITSNTTTLRTSSQPVDTPTSITAPPTGDSECANANGDCSDSSDEEDDESYCSYDGKSI